MSYSIIICTRNRANSLAETLDSVAQLELPADSLIELLIVDNGSTDHTRAVVDRFNHPGITVSYLIESEPGVANARTTALQNACGDILLWTADEFRLPIRAEQDIAFAHGHMEIRSTPMKYG